MTNEIVHQLLIEIDELKGIIDESVISEKPLFIINMYQELLRKKQYELRLLSD